MRLSFDWKDMVVHQVIAEGNCTVCGIECAIMHWLPMYEGKIVTDLHLSDFAMMPVCEACWRPHKDVGARLLLRAGNDWYDER